MREHSARLLAVAQAFAAEETEAEDVLQEAWIRAYHAAPSRPEGMPVLAWLTVITLNAGRDHERRRARRRRLARIWGGATFGSVVPPAESTSLHPRSRLWLAVGALPNLQRDVLILRVVDGCSTAETARLLDRAEGTVKASLSRALTKLRGELTAVRRRDDVVGR
jgi:RNA polymerase sigma-70 factor, ECF subfamily